MKKITTILIATVLALSLTACGGSDGDKAATNKPTANKSTLSTYINEATITNQDNISFVFDQTEDKKAVYLLNIKAPNLLNGLGATEKYTLHNDMLTLRNMGPSFWGSYTAYFTFMGYGEIQLKIYDATEKNLQDPQYETIAQDGDFLLTKNGESYDVWAKCDKEIINITVDGYNGYRITTEQGFIDFYNTVKDHFTFAKTNNVNVTADGLVYAFPNLNNATTWGANKAKSLTGWTFYNDLLYKQIENMGLHFATAQNIFGSNEFYNAQYKVADSAETRIFKVTLSATTGDAPTFDSCDASTEISIGEIKFRKDARNNLYGNDGLGYIFKAKDGKEYAIGIYPTTDFENFADVATEYFNTVVLAK